VVAATLEILAALVTLDQPLPRLLHITVFPLLEGQVIQLLLALADK